MKMRKILAGLLCLIAIAAKTTTANAWFYYLPATAGHPYIGFSTPGANWSSYWDCFSVGNTGVQLRLAAPNNGLCNLAVPTWEIPLPFWSSNNTYTTFGYIRQRGISSETGKFNGYKYRTYTAAGLPYQTANTGIPTSSSGEFYVGAPIVPVHGFVYMTVDMATQTSSEFVGLSWNPDYDQ